MKNEYSFLTKEFLQKEYDLLGSYSSIAKKYKIPLHRIKYYSNKYNIIVHKVGGRIKYSVNENIFSEENEIGFYIAGFIAADGCIVPGYKNSSLVINLSKHDKDHLINIKNLFRFSGSVIDYNNSSKLSIYCSQKLIIDLENIFNIIPNKSLIYKFPQHLINNELIHHFIRGYFDGDGSFYLDHSKRNQKSMCFDLLGTEDVLFNIKNIFNEKCKLGSKTSVFPIKNIYRLRYTGNGLVSKIINYLYKDATIYMPRKYDIIKHLLNC